jgi:hypothetical protein
VRGREPDLRLGMDTSRSSTLGTELSRDGQRSPTVPTGSGRDAPHSSQNWACGQFSRWHRGQGMPSVSRFPIASCRPGQSVTAPRAAAGARRSDRPLEGTAARPYQSGVHGTRRVPRPPKPCCVEGPGLDFGVPPSARYAGAEPGSGRPPLGGPRPRTAPGPPGPPPASAGPRAPPRVGRSGGAGRCRRLQQSARSSLHATRSSRPFGVTERVPA